jgi:hypothetical protein
LAFDSSGNLYAVDGDAGTICEFTPGGTQSTFATGLYRPEDIAFGGPADGGSSTAPEPSSFVLLYTGTAAGVFLLRRRGHKSSMAE